MNTRNASCDVLVVGAGLAGLSVALSLPSHWHVIVLAKHGLADCASSRAQGGIAAVTDPADSVSAHVQDTVIAGAGLCDLPQTQAILQAGAEVINWLQQQGVAFTEQADGQLHLTREGGHGCRRVVHAADHTGWSVTHALQQQLQQRPHTCTMTEVTVQTLSMENGRCVGVEAMGADHQHWQIQAKHVVLATGGLGQLFALTTNPVSATGDGVALAAQAGCRVRQLAYVQFHPTALALPQQPCFLISEAVRGEGGVLRNQAGERFMPQYDERAELAPRDIVARAIAQEMRHGQHQHVNLDISHLQADFIHHHFPSIFRHCWEQHQLDITTTPMPVAPAAHYACGGVVTDGCACSDVPNLYAVGEVACTGLHGANRLASNSLLECVVMGRNAAQHMVLQLAWPDAPTPSSTDTWRWQDIKEAVATESAIGFSDVPFTLSSLQQCMSQQFGIVRHFADMRQLWQQLCVWYQQTPATALAQRHMLVTALLMVHSGLHLQHNHGAHFNQDVHTATPAVV